MRFGWWWLNTRDWSAIDNGVDDFGVEAIVDDGDCVDGGGCVVGGVWGNV